MKAKVKAKPKPPASRFTNRLREGLAKAKMGRQKPQPEPWRAWDLWRDPVHASHIACFLTCRKQFKLHYIECWQNPCTSEALEFGSAVHYVLEHAYRQKKAPSEKQVKAWVKEYEEAYKAEVAAGKKWGVAERDMEKLLGLVERLVPIYFDQWKDDFTYKWLYTEEKVSSEYVYPDGRKVRMGGTIDGGFLKKNPLDRTEFWNLDTKTKGEINIADEAAMMFANFQFKLYNWHTWQKHKRMPNGFIQNIIRRPGMTWKKDEPLLAFLDRVEEDARKRPEHYFVRIEDSVTGYELESWVRTQLNPIMFDLRLWFEGLADISWLPEKRIPTYMNPFSLKKDRRKVDLFDALTTGNFKSLRQAPFHGYEEGN